MLENCENYRHKELPHHTVIKDCLPFLTSKLIPDKKLLADLQNEEILTEESVGQILECRRENTVTEASRKLISFLLRNPDVDHFHQFLKILKQNGQERLCQELIQKYQSWQGVYNPLSGVLLKTEKLFVESVREKYKSLYQFIPRKPWINKDFVEVDKLFVSLELVTKDQEKRLYKQYCDMFNDNSVRSNRYVITGGPGAGKSTLTCKIAFDWSVGRLTQYVCVMLLKAREIPSDINICEYMVKKFVPQDKYNPSVCDSVYNLIQSGQVMLVIDGFDEFRYHNDLSNEIMKIINGDMIPTSPVIITTRPHYIPYLEHNPISAVATFSICGFGFGDVKQYIKLYFSADKSKSTDQIDRTVAAITDGISNVKMWSVVSTPIVCLLMCFLYEQLETLPHKRADVYLQLLAAFRKMYQSRETVNRLTDVHWKGIIVKIGELAWDMLQGDEGGRLVFDHDEVRKYIHPEVACKTGLINLTDPAPSQGITGLIDDVKWYQFLHKSVQEYCAGYYIHEAGVEKLMHYIKDMNTLKSMVEVTEFVIGLQRDHSMTDKILSHVAHTLECHIKDLDSLQSVTHFISFVVMLGECNHSAVEKLLNHVGSVLNSDETLASTEPKFSESYKTMWHDYIKWLHDFEITHKHVTNIKVLYLCHSFQNKYDPKTKYYDSYVNGLLKYHKVAQVTDIPDTPLKYINLGRHCTPNTKQMTSLCSIISVSRNLRHLVGRQVPVPNLGVWLDPDKHPHMEVIDLDDSELSPQSVFNLISKLHLWTHLKKVDLSGSKLDPHTVNDVDIPQCSESLTSLTYIKLSNCNITPVLPLVAHVISLCTNLKRLSLGTTNINMESISVKLQRHCNTRPTKKLTLFQFLKRKCSRHSEPQSVSVRPNIINCIYICGTVA